MRFIICFTTLITTALLTVAAPLRCGVPPSSQGVSTTNNIPFPVNKLHSSYLHGKSVDGISQEISITARGRTGAQRNRKKIQHSHPVGSVVHGAPINTLNQPLFTNNHGHIHPGANRDHPMIVIGHSRKGNLKVVPVSSNPPRPHHPDINQLAPSARLRGKAYVGKQVVVHPNHVSADRSGKKASSGDVQRLRNEVQRHTGVKIHK